VGWDAATREAAAATPQAAIHDVTRLSLTYEGNDERSRVTPELLSQ